MEYKIINPQPANSRKEFEMYQKIITLFVLFTLSLITCSCATMSKTERQKRGIILPEDVKILKPVPNCETPNYFQCSSRDPSWFEWYCEHPDQDRVLAKELDKCQRLLRQPTDELVDTCRRAWMMQVWLTADSDKRRVLAIQTYNSMMTLMRVNGWKEKKVQRYLRPLKIEFAPSSP
jgi:hypothetical protein